MTSCVPNNIRVNLFSDAMELPQGVPLIKCFGGSFVSKYAEESMGTLETLPSMTKQNLELDPKGTSAKRSGNLFVLRCPEVHRQSSHQARNSCPMLDGKFVSHLFLESLNLVPRSSDAKFVCTKENDGAVMFIETIKKYYDYSERELGEDEKGCPSNLKIPCNIGHVHLEKAYIDLNSPLNVMTRMQYNWIMKKQLEPREDPEGTKGTRNFTGRIKGMHIFIGNFTYVSDFMIIEDISSIIDPRLSQVVLGKPFVEASNMTYDLSLGLVKFTYGTNEISYKMPHKIDQYNSLSDLEKEHTKSVYLRNEVDKKKGVEYVMNNYKECLELGTEYLTGLEDEGGVK
ncbi:retrotransposon ORF1 [Tanacetum coccineum]